VVTNSTGSLIIRNVGAAAVTVPVGTSTTTFNPVTIANGGNRDYSVRVNTGLAPTINNPAIAVNRTWTISPNAAPAGPVTLTFQYEDNHMNTPGIPTNPMEVAVHNGSSWTVVTPNVTPTGSATARLVTATTTQFGPTVISNVGGVSWITAVNPVDPTISNMSLMPNLIESASLLRVNTTRATRITWNVVDANGRTVMSFSRQVMTGRNDLQLNFANLAAGMYTISGTTDKGKTQVLRFVKF
jgi:hypothetical protein